MSRKQIFLAGVAGIVVSASLVFATTFLAAKDEKKPAVKEPEFQAADVEFYEKKVKPLLEARCFSCHGPQAKMLKGGLRLDSRAAILKGGDSGPAAVPGNPEKSLIVEAINYKGFEMPPRSKMPAGEIAILTKWVKLGLPVSKGSGKPIIAKEEAFPLEQRKRSHWAWQPIKKQPLPPVRDREWARTEIDRFILAKLEAKGLKPNPQADRASLIRRAYFDVIGLPPSPKDVAAFVNDPAPTPKAFEKVVDGLLKSPQFGERWARHWLDLVRYAETLGHEYDYPLRHAYQYRDYVIRAFNADVPYNQFVTEHLAGDLLKNPRRHPELGYNESVIGPGFWFLGEDKHSPVDVKAEEAGKIDNQIDVFSKTFLGLTLACARCHDHKFDAMTQQDYYALHGFMQSSRRHTAWLDPHRTIENKAAELRKLYEQGNGLLRKELQKAAAATKDDIGRYLLASREVFVGTPKPTDSESAVKTERKPDVVFEDFEAGDYKNWTIKGNSFGRAPVRGTLPRQQSVSGFQGKGLVNSYVGGDDSRGTMTSKPFKIDRKAIRFLIGGGSFAGRTCLNLVVDGNVVRTAAGKNNERLDPFTWDVADLRGKTAVLQIVDNARGGWGHVNVDHIVFSDNATGAITKRTNRPVDKVAAEFRLNAGRLRQLVSQLQSSEVDDVSHPLFAWKQVALNANGDFAKRRAAADRALNDAVALNAGGKTKLFADFNGKGFSGWFPNGFAFGNGATQSGDWDPAGKRAGTLHPGTVDSGRFSNRLCGVLRSPTFTITHDHILYRLKGNGARIRLIIDGYVMDEFNGLLFAGCLFDVNTRGQWQWFRQTGHVHNYKGRTAHIEIIDDGHGTVAVDEIRFANAGDPTPKNEPNAVTQRILKDKSIRSEADLAARFAREISTSLAESNDSGLLEFAMNSGLLTIEKEKDLSDVAKKMQETGTTIPDPVRVISITDGTPEDEHLFIRGSHKNLGPVVHRRMLEAISGSEQKPIKNESGRLELAKRLLAPTNPFPSRVMANRIWHHLTGRGIVASVDNFGVLGQQPTHPELLDHLATTFMEDGWSVKRAIRRIMLTNTYMMSSKPSEAGDRVDPNNDLLHRMRIRRLEGEAIRDAILAVSGRLNPEMYGPSVSIYLTEFMQGRGRPRQSGPLDGDGRRSLYISVRRNFLSPMMLAFDTPIPFTAIGRRNVSNVPAQALILMNDPLVVQQAKRWAKNILAEKTASPQERITVMYQTAFSRRPTKTEIADAEQFLKTQAEALGLKADDWKLNEQVWSDFAHVLFNVKEFIYVR